VILVTDGVKITGIVFAIYEGKDGANKYWKEKNFTTYFLVSR
jgi:hypothetical protein